MLPAGILLCVLLIAAGNSLAQRHVPVENKVQDSLWLPGKLTIDSLTNSVHRHTGIRIAFNASQVKGNTTISFKPGHYSVNDILDIIQRQTSLYYILYKGYVIFQEKPPAASKSRNVPRKTADSTRQANGFRVLPPVIPLSSRFFIKPEVKLPGKGLMKAQTIRTARQRPPAELPEKNTSDHSGDKWLQPYAAAGVQITETWYPQVFASGGFNRLHLLLTAATNYKVASWGIGLGTVIASNENSQWDITATLNHLQRKHDFGDTMDTKRMLKIKGKLLTIGIHWNRFIDQQQRWMFRVGISFNALKAGYYFNDNPVSLSQAPLPPGKTEDLDMLLTPRYSFSNTFSPDQPTYRQTWPGISIGIHYRIF